MKSDGALEKISEETATPFPSPTPFDPALNSLESWMTREAIGEKKSLRMIVPEARAAENRALGAMLATPTPFIGYTPAEIDIVIAELAILNESMPNSGRESTRISLVAARTMLACYRDDQTRKYDEAERAQVAQQLDVAVAAAFANGAAFGATGGDRGKH